MIFLASCFLQQVVFTCRGNRDHNTVIRYVFQDVTLIRFASIVFQDVIFTCLAIWIIPETPARDHRTVVRYVYDVTLLRFASIAK